MTRERTTAREAWDTESGETERRRDGARGRCGARGVLEVLMGCCIVFGVLLGCLRVFKRLFTHLVGECVAVYVGIEAREP